MKDQDFVTVYTVANAVHGEIVKNMLQTAGIRCFLDGVNQAGEAGLTAFEIKVQVPAGRAGEARKLIMAGDATHHA